MSCLLLGSWVGLRADQPDRVWLEPPPLTSSESRWYPASIEKLAGEVIDFDDKQLRINLVGDTSETIFPADRVVWIEVGTDSPVQSSVMNEFRAGKFSESLAAVPTALKERPPVWRQQFLTMVGANAAWKSSRGKIALELVSQLDRRPLPPLVAAWLPIAWHNRAASSDEVSAASERIEDPSPATRLVAASWLLSSGRRADAVKVLHALAADPDRPHLAALANCLLWRTATPPDVEASYPEWETRLEALPMVLQVGPMVTLVEKLTTVGKSEAAKPWTLSLELTPIHPHPAIMPLR